jgi:hypothetical protein
MLLEYRLYIGFLNEDELYFGKGSKKSKPNNFFNRIRKSLFKSKNKEKESIGHITPKTFVLILKKKFIRDYFSLLSYAKSRSSKNEFNKIDEKIKNFEKLISKQEKLAKLEKKEILSYLKVTNPIRRNLNKVDKRKMYEQIEKYKIGLKKRFERDFSSSVSENLVKRIGYVKSNLENIFKGLNMLLLLYPLTIITYPHFNFTRYPTRKMRPKDYNKDLGIVISLPNLLDLIKKILEDFDKQRKLD